MKIKEGTVEEMIRETEAIIQSITERVDRKKDLILSVHRLHQKSALNLIQYLSFRKKDHRKLQARLGYLGMSRLARAEAHIMFSLKRNLLILHQMINQKAKPLKKIKEVSIKKSEKYLVRNTLELLGHRSRGRRLRIMVTFPSDAAEDYGLVDQLVAAGMNCARINCAHDTSEDWLKMIHHVRKAGEKYKRTVKIAMDLAGPKIRTGTILPGPSVKKFVPERDEFGRVIQPATLVITTQRYLYDLPNSIAISEDHLKMLEIGDELTLRDTRKSKRKIIITSRTDNLCNAITNDTSYLAKDIELKHGETVIPILEIVPLEQVITLKKGDTLLLFKDQSPGRPAVYDNEGRVLEHARISCTFPQIFTSIKLKEPIFFDDGKIGGEITKIEEDKLWIKITSTKQSGSKLKADKGINLPKSQIDFQGLTEKDKKDLKFIAEHADIVNFSFVNSPADVEELHDLLRFYGVFGKLGVIYKIETQRAYNNIADILIKAMQTHPIGIMIARGDLAVETGWDQIGIIQKEILAICNSAHIPVIWATQVLENLAKKGLPSRSEITDAVTSLKAECVMLNKGPYIEQAILLLDKILSDMEDFQSKNAPMLPELERI